jgi:hypothetical protein
MGALRAGLAPSEWKHCSDVPDDGDKGRVAKQKAPYEGYGFVLVPSNPLRLFLPLGAVLSLI